MTKKLTLGSEKLQQNLSKIAAALSKIDDGYRINLQRQPKALAMTLKPQPEGLRLPLIVSLLPLLGSYASDVVVEYVDGKRMSLDLMAIIVANQSGSKGACRDVQNLWLVPMRREDGPARQQEERMRKKNRGRKASERAEEDPGVVIREVPITISNATLLRRLKNAKGKALYSFGEELDTLAKTNKAGAWSQKTDCYRLAFDRGIWGQDFNSDQSESGMVQVAYNWTVCGTFGSLRRFFTLVNVENGLAGRVIPSETPNQAFRPIPKFKPFPEGTEEAVEEAVARLQSLHGFIDTPKLRKTIEGWCELKRLEALADGDESKDILRRRSAVIGFRAGAIHHLLTGNDTESNASLDFALLIAEYCLQEQMRLWGAQLKAALDENIQPALYEGCNVKLYDQLPEIFTLGDLGTLKGKNHKESSLRTIVYRWRQAGWITDVDKGQYKKVKPSNPSQPC